MSKDLVNKATGNTLWGYFEARNDEDNLSATGIIEKVILVLNEVSSCYKLFGGRRKEIIKHKVDRGFGTEIFKTYILEHQRDISGLINPDNINRHRRKESLPTKAEYLDFYAIYCGFVGINGFINNLSLYNCFEIGKTEDLIINDDIERRLIPPEINYINADILIRKYQAKEDFYRHYNGYYNVFFIDELTVHKENQKKPPKFEVANFVFESQRGKFYFKELKTENLKGNDLFPLENSPKSNFYVQEIDIGWAYMFSFERPKKQTGIINEFPILQLGSTQRGYHPFAGIGYAVRVQYPYELILPNRGLLHLDANLLRMHPAVTTVEVNGESQTERDGCDIYKEVFEKGKPLNGTIKNKLSRIEKILRSSKNLYYYREKKTSE